MSITEIIFVMMGVYMVLKGLASLFTGKVYSTFSGKYTEESLARYARPLGCANLLIGAGIVAHNLVKTHLFTLGGISMSIGLTALIVCGVVGIIILIASNKLLVKRTA